MRHSTIIRTLLAGFCLAAALFALGQTPSVAYASPQSINYVPLAPIDVEGSEIRPGTEATAECRAPTCFPRYLRTLYNVGIALAGLFAVVSIVRGGFTLMFTDSILGHSEGKSIILRALGGLVIVYSSYILMNLINPALGRDLDLALQFERVRPTPTPTPLTVVEMSEYQQGLLRDARVRNDAWRAAEEARLTREIGALNTELTAERAKGANADEEVINILLGNINIKTADLETLRREGVVQKVEYEAQKAANVPNLTQEQLQAIIDKIMKDGADGTLNGIAQVHAAFDAVVDNTPGLTAEQKAQIRASEANRVASIHRLLADGLLVKDAFDSLTIDKIGEQMLAIDKAREYAISKLPSTSDQELLAKIKYQEGVIWNQSCHSIALIYYKCRDLKSGCWMRLPQDVKNRCEANSGSRF